MESVRLRDFGVRDVLEASAECVKVERKHLSEEYASNKDLSYISVCMRVWAKCTREYQKLNNEIRRIG